MESLCEQLWFCSVLAPSQWHWFVAATIPIVAIILVAIPITNILRRAGRSGWWTVLAFVPLLNLICLWIFAFTTWPAVQNNHPERM
jgi:hypothetical protein